ncbi:hypothetical protein HOO65_050016 [Ceratocystis lukuohia]|uniref:Secreted protein n=1 Tax=Ceratocystis lukuohia TaxID=2019550 RepID=A0ABR4MF52_9PEZI
MLLPKFIQSLFMAALLSTQVIAGDKQVPRARDLALYIPKDGQYGWKEVRTTEGFFAKVYISQECKFIEVDKIENPTDDFKSYEALLSIWEHQSGLTVKSLQRIIYDNNVGSDADIIIDALKKLGRDPVVEGAIYGVEVSRDSSDQAEIWDLLSRASFAKDAVKICTEFQEMSNRYIHSYKIGKYPDSRLWVHVVFSTKHD